MYRPLYKTTIKNSTIEGLGLFATEDLREGELLGLSHIEVAGEVIRTPLGGFINHSDEPNAIRVNRNGRHYIHTLRNIVKGEEITLKYKFYSI